MNANKKQFSKILICTFLALIAFSFAHAANAATQSAASFVSADTVSQGNWQGKYGADGYSIANSLQVLPTYASFAPQNQLNWSWTTNTTDPRALQAINGNGRLATTWFSPSTFSFDINLTDGKSHQVALYALDWDCNNRSETIQILDASSGSMLDTRSISNFTGGMYLVWNLTGHVKATIAYTAGTNAVVSAVFFGGATSTSTVPATAAFVTADTTTEGNWIAKYGSDGYSIAMGASSVPSYATFIPQNQQSWTWISNTSDPRVLQSPNGSSTAPTCWFGNLPFSFDVNFTDSKTHQLAFYALDWDLRSRSESIQIVDANSGATLDTRQLSNFSSGTFLVWNISGHVTVNVLSLSGPNAVVSGVFFATPNPSTASNGATAPSITAQPANKNVSIGQTATFSVSANGTAPLTYQWKKNGVAISRATSSTYTTPVTTMPDNGSQFTVSVSNGTGSATSNAAILTVSGTYILNSSSASVSFGSVNVSNTSQQSVTLTNAGTANVTISNVSVSGAGFNASGVPAGTILTPGQSATLMAIFDPASTGSSSGSITLTSNATGGAKVITLSGTGTAPTHSVALSWSASTSSTVVGYNVYVSTVSGTSYMKLTSTPVAATTYTDGSLQTVQTRYYVVTSVDSNNDESGYSNQVSAVIP